MFTDSPACYYAHSNNGAAEMNDKPKGGRGKIETERNAAVVADRAAGMAYKLLERKYGISRSRLVHIINAARDAS